MRKMGNKTEYLDREELWQTPKDLRRERKAEGRYLYHRTSYMDRTKSLLWLPRRLLGPRAASSAQQQAGTSTKQWGGR